MPAAVGTLHKDSSTVAVTSLLCCTRLTEMKIGWGWVRVFVCVCVCVSVCVLLHLCVWLCVCVWREREMQNKTN